MNSVLKGFKVIPVVTLDNEEDAQRKLSSLVKGDLLVAEITFRTDYALEGIKYAVKNYPQLLVGAGTVLNINQCKDAVDAGCKFIVSPGFSREIALFCKEKNILYIPGCVTPTEIMEALIFDLKLIKFFPANIYGGLTAINSLGAVFKGIKFIPTGGIDENNLKDYLSNKYVEAVGGSFIMKGNITENCLSIKKIIDSIL